MFREQAFSLIIDHYQLIIVNGQLSIVDGSYSEGPKASMGAQRVRRRVIGPDFFPVL